MALPSARRPAFVEKELELESKKIVRVKVNKFQCFMDQMNKWLSFLTNKEKATLTAKKFKRRALLYLAETNYEYKKLAPNWLETLLQTHNIRLLVKKKIRKPEFVIPISDHQELSIIHDPLTHMPGKRGILPEKMKTEVTEVDNGCVNGPMEGEREESVVDGKEIAVVPPKRLKRFLDFTNKPPPKEWLKAHSQGIHLHRELTVYSNDDLNILFYDYTPKFQEDLNLKQQVHDGNGFKWWRSAEQLKRDSSDFGLNS